MKKILSIFSSFKILSASLTFIILLLIYDTIGNKGISIIKSNLFLILNLILFLNILSCLCLRWLNNIKMSLSFTLIHSGILIIISGFIVSSLFSFEAEMFLRQGSEEALVLNEKGELFRLPFRIRLNDFNIKYYKQPKPVLVYKGENEKTYDCIEGLEIKIDNTIYRVEKFFSDFVIEGEKKFSNRTPFYNNPAALISSQDKKIKGSFWIFLNNPNSKLPFTLKLFDSDIKDYLSELDIIYKGKTYKTIVSVNKPFSFNGYKIYQTGFEPSEGKSVILTIKKDNFIWLVFSGFIILGAGVILWII